MTDRTGTCFEDAFRIASRLRNESPTIVHGIPLGRGGDADGLRYWHAWVEVGDVVHAPTAPGKHVEVSKMLFYLLGKIDPEHCRRFSLREAVFHATDVYGHYGPWVGRDERDFERVLREAHPDEITEYDHITKEQA